MPVYLDRRTKDLVVVLRPPGKLHWRIACFGTKRHYRKDGSCRHTEALVERARSPWHRARMRIDGWGGKGV